MRPCPDGRLLFAQVVVTIWEGFTADALRLGSGNLNPILAVELISCVMWRKQLQPHYNMVCVCGGGVSTCSQGGMDNQVSQVSELHVLGTRDYCSGCPKHSSLLLKLLSKYSGLSAGHCERACVESTVERWDLWL